MEVGATQVSESVSVDGAIVENHHATVSPSGQYIAYYSELFSDLTGTDCKIIIHNRDDGSENSVICQKGVDSYSLAVDNRGEFTYSKIDK